MDITVSIVTYKNDPQKLNKLFESLNHSSLEISVHIMDNSHTDDLEHLIKKYKVHYTHNGKNPGYGSAHNILMKESLYNAKYHLVLNPDIHFEDNVLEKLYSYMEEHRDIGLIMPKVLYPDGSLQYLCKLLPRPSDLILRRFFQPLKLIEKVNSKFELRFADYDNIMDVPYLSGCFMFLRKDALHKAGLFDERFFMYFEDTDLSRRIHRHYRTVYYPHVTIYHDYEKGSYKDKGLLWAHLKSAIRYFNKWGWFFDKDRRKINNKTINNLNNR